MVMVQRELLVNPSSATNAMAVKFLLESKVASRKPVVPNIDLYLQEINNGSHALAFLAARNGDIFILETILDPTLPKLCERELELKVELHQDTPKIESLGRRKRLFEVILKTLEEFYERHKATVLAFLKELKIKADSNNYKIIYEIVLELSTFCALDDLEIDINANIDKTLYELALEHRAHLIAQKHAFIDGKHVELNDELRVRLHKQFLNNLEHHDLETDIVGFNIIQLMKDYRISRNWLAVGYDANRLMKLQQRVKNKIRSITLQIALLEEQQTPARRELELLDYRIIEAKSRHRDNFFNMLDSLQFTSDFQPLSQLDPAAAIHDLMQISINEQHPINGNSLLHEALLAGQFHTALYLINKGANFCAKNSIGTVAVDTIDKNGDTLLHYLARSKQYELMCTFILKGAKVDISNNNQLQPLDIIVNGNSLLQFLLGNISSPNAKPEYLDVAKILTEKCLTIPHLLTNTKSGMALDILAITPLSDILKESREHDHYKSPFQVDINFILWKHFFLLVSQQSLPSLLKFFGNLVTSRIADQLKFLEGLYYHLQTAKKTGSDEPLFLYLNKMAEDLSFPGEIHEEYNKYLKLAKEDFYHRREGFKDMPLYTALEPAEARDCYLNSSYKTVVQQLDCVAENSTIEKKPDDALTATESAISFNKVFSSPAKKPTTQSVDPLRWFANSTLSSR